MIVDFPDIFSHFFPQEYDDLKMSVEQFRANLYAIDESWMKDEPQKSEVENFILDRNKQRYILKKNGIDFHVLFLENKNYTKKLYVSLCGGGRKVNKYPRFLRWKYKNFLDGHYLCIEDPMYADAGGSSSVTWYYGSKDTFLCYEMVDIINKFMIFLNIESKNLIFFGSSGGGTAAIHMANYFDYSTCYALNPQYNLGTWSKASLKAFLKRGINLKEHDEKYERNIVQIKNKTSYYFLVENCLSKKDEEQFKPWFTNKKLPIKYGIHQYGNVITWIHATDSARPHNANPLKFSFILLNYVRDKVISGYNIELYRNLFLFYNEIFREYYQQTTLVKKFETLSQNIINIIVKKIIDMYPELEVKECKDGKDLYYSRVPLFYYRFRYMEGDFYLYIVAKSNEQNVVSFMKTLFEDNDKLLCKKSIYYKFILQYEEGDIEEKILSIINDTINKIKKFRE